MADWKVFTPARTPDTDEIRSDGAIFVASGSGGGTVPVIGYAQAGSVSGLSGVTPTTTPCFTFGTQLPGYGGDTGRKLYIPETFTITLDSMAPGGTSVTMPPGWYQLSSVTPIGVNPLTAIDPPEISYADSDVTGASYKAPFFDCMCFEEGTTACKLAVTNEAKTLIRNALINKGVDVPDTTPFRQYAGKIEGIETGSNIEILTFDIQPDDYENVSSWWDEEHMHEYTEALWHIQGPYVFKSKTYNSINELLLDVSANNIYFAMGSGSLFFQRPISIVDGTFKFISKDKGLDTETLYMIVNFGDGV